MKTKPPPNAKKRAPVGCNRAGAERKGLTAKVRPLTFKVSRVFDKYASDELSTGYNKWYNDLLVQKMSDRKLIFCGNPVRVHSIDSAIIAVQCDFIWVTSQSWSEGEG